MIGTPLPRSVAHPTSMSGFGIQNKAGGTPVTLARGTNIFREFETADLSRIWVMYGKTTPAAQSNHIHEANIERTQGYHKP